MENKHVCYGPYEKWIKRPLDIVCALAALIVFCWLYLILAFLVRIKLGSPVLFTQNRVGRDERIVKLYKFRTMTEEKDEDGNLLPDEKRLTKFGRLLRSTSLDELPEAINILKGDMSIIGPRPLVEQYVPYYTEEEHHRHDVRPGLSGLAQVNGRNFIDWDHRLAFDVQYVKKITFIGDLRIILQTALKFIKKEDIAVDTNKVESNFAEERRAKRGLESMNILILSAGTRNKIVQYFVKTLNGKGRVIATDMSNLAPAIYEADKHHIVPKMTAPEYLDVVLDICKKEEITGVLSLIDPELSLLAGNREKFEAIGTTVIGSSYALCEMSLDKFQMYKWLTAHGYKCAKSYMDKEAFLTDVDAGGITYPVFVKPARGSASISISKVYDRETVELLFAHEDGLMIQEFLNGQEIGADVYIDMVSHEVVSIFTKKKLKMRAGETDKAVSFQDEKLFALIERFVRDAGYSAQIDIDIFDVNGEYYISEVNPRFGGGYPHAFESGADHMKLIVNNLEGKANECVIGQYENEIYMMKYNEVSIIR